MIHELFQLSFAIKGSSENIGLNYSLLVSFIPQNSALLGLFVVLAP
jgi:hypothetical protein